MDDDAQPIIHRYVRAEPPLEVLVDGPRGTFRGFANGWWPDRQKVDLRWTEGPGMTYVQVLPAERVRRA